MDERLYCRRKMRAKQTLYSIMSNKKVVNFYIWTPIEAMVPKDFFAVSILTLLLQVDAKLLAAFAS